MKTHKATTTTEDVIPARQSLPPSVVVGGGNPGAVGCCAQVALLLRIPAWRGDDDLSDNRICKLQHAPESFSSV